MPPYLRGVRDTRQGLSAKAEGGHRAQVTELSELGRREALAHDGQVLPATRTTPTTTSTAALTTTSRPTSTTTFTTTPTPVLDSDVDAGGRQAGRWAGRQAGKRRSKKEESETAKIRERLPRYSTRYTHSAHAIYIYIHVQCGILKVARCRPSNYCSGQTGRQGGRCEPSASADGCRWRWAQEIHQQRARTNGKRTFYPSLRLSVRLSIRPSVSSSARPPVNKSPFVGLPLRAFAHLSVRPSTAH